jgi:hypothetical protein
VEGLREQLALREAEAERLHAQLLSTAQEVEGLRSQLVACSEDAQQAGLDRDTAQGLWADSQSTLEAVRGELVASQAELEGMRQALAAAQLAARQAQEELHSVHAELERLQGVGVGVDLLPPSVEITKTPAHGTSVTAGASLVPVGVAAARLECDGANLPAPGSAEQRTAGPASPFSATTTVPAGTAPQASGNDEDGALRHPSESEAQGSTRLISEVSHAHQLPEAATDDTACSSRSRGGGSGAVLNGAAELGRLASDLEVARQEVDRFKVKLRAAIKKGKTFEADAAAKAATVVQLEQQAADLRLELESVRRTAMEGSAKQRAEQVRGQSSFSAWTERAYTL